MNQRTAFWGTGAVFHFGDKIANPETGPGLPLEAKAKHPATFINLSGWHSTYPTSVELPNWQWALSSAPDQPDPTSEKWAYQFSLPAAKP